MIRLLTFFFLTSLLMLMGCGEASDQQQDDADTFPETVKTIPHEKNSSLCFLRARLPDTLSSYMDSEPDSVIQIFRLWHEMLPFLAPPGPPADTVLNLGAGLS